MRGSWLLPPCTRVCLNFIHPDIQTRNQDIGLPSKRFIVTLAVCQRLFEFPTADARSTAQKSHRINSILRPSQKKQKQRKPVVYVRSAMYHESSRTRPKLGRECCVGKKQDLMSMAVPQKNDVCTRTKIIPQGIYLRCGLN